MQALFQSLTKQLDLAARDFPAAVAEVRAQNADAAKALESAFADIDTHLAALREQFAEFAVDFDKQLEEAGRMAQDAMAAFEHAIEPSTTPASVAPLRPPFDLAPMLGAELLDRYVPKGPAAKEHAAGDSSVWFDFSSHGSEAGAVSKELAETLTILAGLNRRCTVWWTCVAMSEAISNVWNMLTANDRSAVESAVAWVIHPDQSRLQSTIHLAAHEPPGSLAHGIGEMFRMIGTTDPHSVSERDVAEAAMAVLRQACTRLDTASTAKVVHHARAIAVDVQAGRRLWQGHPPEASVNVVDSLATFSRWMSNE